jgi:hypothetical protein
MKPKRCSWCGETKDVYLSVPYRAFTVPTCLPCFEQIQIPKLTPEEKAEAIKAYQEDIIYAMWMEPNEHVKEGAVWR